MPRDLVDSLRQRLAGAETRLADLGTARQALLLPGVTGNGKARTALDDNAGQISLAERDVSDLKAAITQADQQYREERLADAKRAGEQKLAEAKRMAVEFLEADKAIDHALAAIGAAITKRKELAIALIATGCLRDAYMNRLIQPGTLWRAIHFFGFGHFIKTPTHNAMRATLHSQDETILSTLHLPALERETVEVAPPSEPDPRPAPIGSEEEEAEVEANALSLPPRAARAPWDDSGEPARAQ